MIYLIDTDICVYWLKGNVINDADMFIASCALVNGFTLVTNNERHFKRIKELKVENWIK
ncbi:MAG: hypothetical protein ACUZ8E_01295 [Candidatus Anammoxibacter sp.]